MEKERRWWWWIDRWLEPRWRALLTWVVLALLTFKAFQGGAELWIGDGLSLLTGWFAASTGVTVPQAVSYTAYVANVYFVMSWYPPVLLRLGLFRAGAWIALSVALMSAASFFIDYSWSGPMIMSHALGIPALAAVKVRTRPWLSVVAGVFAAMCAWMILRKMEDSHDGGGSIQWLAALIPTTLYGAVMLYGTAPLPPKPRET